MYCKCHSKNLIIIRLSQSEKQVTLDPTHALLSKYCAPFVGEEKKLITQFCILQRYRTCGAVLSCHYYTFMKFCVGTVETFFISEKHNQQVFLFFILLTALMYVRSFALSCAV